MMHEQEDKSGKLAIFNRLVERDSGTQNSVKIFLQISFFN